MDPSHFGLSGVPKPDKHVCAVCQREAAPGETLKRCQKCRTMPYCSKECQVADWKKHKKICYVYMRDGALGSTAMNAGGGSSKGKKGRGARTRADVMKDMSTWAQEHNGDTLTIACWQAMDLVKDIRKADTHFLGVTLRKNEDWTNVRAMYKLVDAQVLPLTLVAQKYATVADAYDEHPVDVIDQVLGADKRRRLADGGLGSVLVMAFELSPDENMTVEEAVLKKNTPTLQPLGLFQVHKDSFSRRPQMFASFWKQSLKNALDGGAWDPVFRPWPAAQS